MLAAIQKKKKRTNKNHILSNWQPGPVHPIIKPLHLLSFNYSGSVHVEMLRPPPRHERVKVVPALSAAAAPPLATTADARTHIPDPTTPSITTFLFEPNCDLAGPRLILPSTLQVAVANQYEATVRHHVERDPSLLATPQLP